MGIRGTRTLAVLIAGVSIAGGSWALGSASANSAAAAEAGTSSETTPVVLAAGAQTALSPQLAALKAAPVVTKACANKKTGALSVKGAGTKNVRCSAKEKAVRFASASLSTKGTLRFTSSNGLYTFALTNTGVGMRGPGGSIIIDARRVQTLGPGGQPQ